MNGNCHFIFGVSVGTAIAVNLDVLSEALPQITDSPETAALFVMGGIIGGIFPDIDNPSSHIGKLSVPVSTVIGKIGAAFGKKGSHHRGILHDPIVYIIGLILSYFLLPPLVGFFIGCLSHIFLDMFNPAGVPFMFGVKRLHLGKVISGSKSSVWLTWVSSCLVLGLGIGANLRIL